MRWLETGLAMLAAGAWAPAPLAAQPDTATRRPFRFAVLGHIRGGPGGSLNPKLGELLARVREQSPDFVVLTGDIVYGDVHGTPPDSAKVRRQWDEVDSALATVGAPIYRVPGNHDISDLGTKRLWWQRYGPVPRVIERFGSRLILLGSAWIPDEGDSVPRRVVRPAALDSGQVTWLRETHARPVAEHGFVFLHHLLWWNPEASWWREVHPVLRESGIRFVFGGDYGPLKFSQVTRDSIRYVQASMEGIPDLDILRDLESSRILSAQFDNFLMVRVEGPTVEVEVETFAEWSAPQYQPAFYQAMIQPRPVPLRDRVLQQLRSPRRLLVLGALGFATFAAGYLAGRLRKGRRATLS